MFKTRDYAVMILAIAFLVIAIGATLMLSSGFGFSIGQSAALFVASEDTEQTYDAEIAVDEIPSRESRIEQLRKKIAALGDQVISAAPEPEEVKSPVPEVPAVGATPEVAKENRCASYHASSVAWNPRGLLIEEVEGARLVFREVPGLPLASSTEPVVTKSVVLQLPLRSLPLPSQTCIGTDVIGVATDGSLIRNNEVGVYKIFGSNTLIGYALDGFPIYGLTAGNVDICGGVMVAGQYRYHLKADRETIINCFAGTPVAF